MTINNNIVLITGAPNTGKSTSLQSLNNPEKAVYLNTDKKPLPLPIKFKKSIQLDHPDKILSYLTQIEGRDDIDTIILDTLTFLMQMYERMCVRTAADGRAAWGDYGAFYGDFIDKIKSSKKQFCVMAHEDRVYNEDTLEFISKVPVKGAVGKIGVEADFTIVLASRKISLSALEGIENDLLNITDEEREDGEKYVFMTRPFKGDGSCVRSPLKMWARDELYIDNDIQKVFNRINEYYK